MLAHDETTPLVGRGDASRAHRTRVFVFGAIALCVGALASSRVLNATSAWGSSLGIYGVVERKASGELILHPPKADECSAACDVSAEKHKGTYAYYDTECHMGGFGCNFGQSVQCRACQTEPYVKHGQMKWHYVQCPQCVCNKHNATGCNVCVSKYKYYRFQVQTTRFKDGYQKDRAHCQPHITQFAEIKMYTNDGKDKIPLDASQSKVLNGQLCQTWQGPDAASDENLETKMCELGGAIDSADGLNFVFAAKQPTQFTHYEIFTAEDCEGRDPTSWTLYGSTVSNEGPWAELAQRRVDPPTARKTSYGKLQVC